MSSDLLRVRDRGFVDDGKSRSSAPIWRGPAVAASRRRPTQCDAR